MKLLQYCFFKLQAQQMTCPFNKVFISHYSYFSVNGFSPSLSLSVFFFFYCKALFFFASKMGLSTMTCSWYILLAWTKSLSWHELSQAKQINHFAVTTLRSPLVLFFYMKSKVGDICICWIKNKDLPKQDVWPRVETIVMNRLLK